MTEPLSLPIPEPYDIRRLSTRDAAALLRFYNGLTDASKRLFRPIGIVADSATCAAIARENEIAGGDRYDMIALLGDEVVGWCFLWGLQGNKPSLGVGIADAHRGKRLGKTLMATVMDFARRRQMPALNLTVVHDNEVAVRLYEQFGFSARGRYVDDQDGLTYYAMVADLDCPGPFDTE